MKKIFNFRKKTQEDTALPGTISVWNPQSENAAPLAYELALELAKGNRTFIAELPCLGIPRLAHESAKMVQESIEQNIDRCLLEFDRTEDPHLDDINHDKENNLGYLCMNPKGNPELNTTMKLFDETAIDVLAQFPEVLLTGAKARSYLTTIFLLQGQMVNPMTFCSMLVSDFIVLDVNTPTGIAWALRVLEKFKDHDQMAKKKVIVYMQEEERKNVGDAFEVVATVVTSVEEIVQEIINHQIAMIEGAV